MVTKKKTAAASRNPQRVVQTFHAAKCRINFNLMPHTQKEVRQTANCKLQANQAKAVSATQ